MSFFRTESGEVVTKQILQPVDRGLKDLPLEGEFVDYEFGGWCTLKNATCERRSKYQKKKERLVLALCEYPMGVTLGRHHTVCF